jgi:5'-nucleotidase / UDP-sugar diphosphatase
MKKMMAISLALTAVSMVQAYTPGKTYKITVLHTNDNHGRFWQNRDGEYGMAARATLIKNLREEVKQAGGHVLLLDAGDVNTGVPQSDLLDAEPDFLGMKAMGYDVMAIGNHEFDNTLEMIKEQRKWAGFPFISANIYYKDSARRVFPSHVVKEIDDLKVTIFGLTTEDTPLKSNKENTKYVRFTPAVAEAKKIVPWLKQNTDVLIALTHTGHYPDEQNGPDAPGDVTIARQTRGIDLIVGGHTQKPLFEPDFQNGTAIVQAYEWGKYVGKVDMEFIDGKLTVKSSKLIPVNLKDSQVRIEPDKELEALLKPFKDKGDANLLVEIGKADVEYVGTRNEVRSKETNLANLVLKANKEKYQADVAVLNGGSMRDSIYPGKITYESILMVQPFGSELVLVSLTGTELKGYLEFILINLLPESGSFPHFAGIDIVGDANTRKIKKLLVDGKDLDNNRSYKLVLPEFIAAGGDRYPVLQFSKTGDVDANVLKDYIQKIGNLNAAEYAPRGYVRFE